MLNIKLPFWISAEQTEALTKAATNYWSKIEAWLRWPLDQMDPLTCTPGMLDLLAWQRDIERFTTEPLDLYRKRVKFALINAQDAGSKAGFIRIFERLGIGYVEIEERVDPVDWDVILVHLSDSQLSENTELLNRIIQKYGRTCRRYQLTVITPIQTGISVKATGHTWWFDTAIQTIAPWWADNTIENNATGNAWSLDIAKL
ncbi:MULTISPECIES: phage tail protein [unclassified Methylophaga]|jgi:P2-related tail formation protein|uniref:phage tail protein n=1 Tax=unclassified Methylophaga TaxID=2629249 RepID=UPI00259CD9EB|nr:MULTISPECIES: phage tail protein [unclassified Methylophaga]|tara:strand:+ start:27869 stop:28474 length:606 start_codon:yes stop_codon:yes gene_type:complete